MLESLLGRIPDDFFKGVGIITIVLMPGFAAWMWKLAQQIAADRYDLAQLGKKAGTERGVEEAERLTCELEKKNPRWWRRRKERLEKLNGSHR